MLNLIYGKYLSHSHAVSPDPHATRLGEPNFQTCNVQHRLHLSLC